MQTYCKELRGRETRTALPPQLSQPPQSRGRQGGTRWMKFAADPPGVRRSAEGTYLRPRGAAGFPHRKVSRRSSVGLGAFSPPHTVPPPTVRRSCAVLVRARSIASLPAAAEGRARCCAGRERSSLRPFIPASPKRIRFDVQPGFLWVWSEPVQPSLGDTPLSKSYIFYITSFPAWLPPLPSP